MYNTVLCNIYGIENVWPEETFPIVMWYNERYYTLEKRDSLLAVSPRYRRWWIVTTKHSLTRAKLYNYVLSDRRSFPDDLTRPRIVASCYEILNKHAIITNALLISLSSHKMSRLPLNANNPNLTLDFWFGAPKQRTPNKKPCEVWDLSRTEASLVRGVSLINN